MLRRAITLCLEAITTVLLLQVFCTQPCKDTFARTSTDLASGEKSPPANLLQEILDKLTAVSGKPADLQYKTWPPSLQFVKKNTRTSITSGEDPNAYADAENCVPQITITEDLASDVLQYQPDRIAFVLGHELSHLLLGHVRCGPEAPNTPLIYAALSRDQEYAADKNGLMLALKAGYSAPAALQAFRIMDQSMGGSSFEALAQEHPSFKDRLAQLDAAQSELWRAMSAFEDGVYFLGIQQYEPARECFTRVVHDYPDAAEAWLDLGYAELMEYVDQLSEQNVRAFGIGQLAVGGYYGTSVILAHKLRGIDRELWNSAVEAFGQVSQLLPDSALAAESLGIAYLVHPDGAPKIDRALMYLERADHDEHASVTATGRVSILINLAVAYAAAERYSEAREHLNEAMALYQKLPDRTWQYFAVSAIDYNLGSIAVESHTKSAAASTAQDFEQYLSLVGENSAWWPIAREKYVAFCETAKLKPKPDQQLHSAYQQIFRPLTSVQLENGVSVTLGDPFAQTTSKLGRGEEIAIAGSLRQVIYPSRGLSVIGDDEILAIDLRDRNAPSLQIRAFGPAQQQLVLSIGMPMAALKQRLEQIKMYPYSVPLIAPQTRYTYFPGIGLAVGEAATQKVSELVLARIPVQ